MDRAKLFLYGLKRRLFRRDSKKAHISLFAYVDASSSYGKHVYIDRFCVLHNVHIGDFSYIGYSSAINACTIGRFCSISSGVKIGLGKHPTHFVSTSPAFYSCRSVLGTQWVDADSIDFKETEWTVVGNDVWIGANALIMDGVSIGDGSIVAAGAVVTKDVEPYTIVGGVPASLLRQRFPSEVIASLLEIRWWDWDIETLQQRAQQFHDVSAFISRFSS